MSRQCLLLWGPAGSGKSNLLATAARGYHEASGRKVRLVSAESIQSQSMLSELITAGIVEAWFLDQRKETPFERMYRSVLGDWPLDPQEPLSPLVPAFTFRFKATCDKCQTTPYDSEKAPEPAALAQLKCPKCKEPLLVRTLRVPNPRNGIQHVGMYLFEGLTEFSQMMMDNMADRVAKLETMGGTNEKQGGDVAVRFRDGDYWVGGNTQSHYGTAQRQIKLRVDESKHLIGADYVLWTAVEADDRDEKNKRQGRCFGPKVAGTAATPDIQRWFGPTLGTRIVPAGGDGNKEVEFRLYMQTYFQKWDALDKNVPNLCNNRIPPHQLKRGEPGGVPDFYPVKPEDKTLLWRVIQLIDEKQGLSPLRKDGVK